MLGSSNNHSWPAEKHPTLCQRGAYEEPFIRRIADSLSWKSALTPWLEEALVGEIGGSTWSASSQANRWLHNRHRRTGSRMLSDSSPCSYVVILRKTEVRNGQLFFLNDPILRLTPPFLLHSSLWCGDVFFDNGVISKSETLTTHVPLRKKLSGRPNKNWVLGCSPP